MNFLRYLWLSSSGFLTYRSFLELPFRSVMRYWGMLALILTTVLIGNGIDRFEKGFPAIQRVAVQLPPFSLTNGQAFSTLPQPWFANTNRFPIILDLGKKIDEPQKMFSSGILIRKPEFSFWIEGSLPMVVSWKGWPDGEVNTAYLDWIHYLTFLQMPWICGVIWLVVLLLGMIMALFFTVLAGFLERSIQPGYTFSQLFNIALFAITPGAIVASVYLSLGLHEIQYAVLYLSCHCLFFVMASGACRQFLQSSAKDPSDED